MSVFESYWANKSACDDAERAYYEKLSGCKSAQAEAPVAKTEGGSASEEELAKNPGAFKNAANGERTFIMCKPDAVQRGFVGEIMERFERRGLRLLCAKMMHAPESLLKEHYADLSKKGFFSELIRYMGSGAVVPMVWQGLGAVKQGRVLLGATNPKDSAPGTIRGDLCIDVGRNIIHGSDSVESAEKEIGLWFSQAEITSWRSAQTEWVYEEEELEPVQVLPSKMDGLVSASGSSEDMALVKKLNALEVENKQLKKVTDDLKALVLSLEARVGQLEGGKPAAKAPAKAAPAPAEEDDDDVDLFGSSDEEESEEKKRITEERLKAYHEKKSKKPQVIAKTSVLLDVKPWDDETDHDAMLASVKSIEMDGLTWGAHKLIPIGYGIKKLQVMCTVVDDKVSVEELQEKIEEFEDFVQSCDVNAMNKI
jgi:nucleoside diphosphate kinase/translation elongation factor EF-1beta